MNSKIYPIGVQNFESLRKDDYFYIDKTALVYQLADREILFSKSPSSLWKKFAYIYAGSLLQGKKNFRRSGYRDP